MKRILIVVTSNDQFGTTGKKTGYYLPEVSHAVARFKAAGIGFDFASPRGGHAPMDPTSIDRTDPDNAALLDDAEIVGQLDQTLATRDVRAENYGAVYFAGGMGTMWDFAEDPSVGKLAVSAFERGAVVSAVCHGPAAFLSAKLASGRWLVDGQAVSCFTNAEETAAGNDPDIPYHLETALGERGAKHASAPIWQPHVVVSGRLITGQNPASARGVADQVLALLAADGSREALHRFSS